MRRLVSSTLLAALALPTGCVEINRGAIVQMNLKSIAPSVAGEHYQLFAVVHGGAVPIARFKVMRAIEDCGQDPDLVPPLTLVQAYDNGADRATVCDQARRLGAIDEINLAAGLLVGGIRVDTAKDLGDATSVFISVEVDGDSDPRPAAAVMTADLGAGRSPHEAVALRCLEDYCDEVPDDAVCASITPLDRARRGVLVGTFVRTPVADACNALVTGEIAIVPAQDDTEF